MLKVVETQKCESLRERMDDAGCVFEFVVLAPEIGAVVDEAMHRQALLCFYEHLTGSPFSADDSACMSWDLDKAVATPLNQEEVHRLMLTQDEVGGPLALYAHFREPPYLTEFKGAEPEAQALFHEWREVLGLEEQDGIVVLNWVKGFKLEWLDNDDAIPGREPWSDYFDHGLEWWGVWCLTIWNPRRRTLSALIASATD